jgi:membrane-associated phospholipid phosphatase
MLRSVGATELLSSMPEWVVVAFAVLTQLGDAWFVFVALSLLYWFAPTRVTTDRRRVGALLVALSLCALAVTVGLKAAFALPRPPGATEAVPPAWLPEAAGAFYRDLATGDGFGFPSGHAIGATVAYGGAAVLLDGFDRRRRLLAAGGVVGVVALSRVVLGVHYLADVVVGVLVGAALVAAVRRGTDDRPEYAFAVAVVLGLLAAAVVAGQGSTGALHEAAAAVGGGLGGRLAWRYLRSEATVPPALALVGLAVCGGLWSSVYALEPSLVVTVVVDAVAVGGILGVPWLAARVARK